MQKLSYIVILFFILINGIMFSQTSPHGDGFKIECKVCHTTESWKVKESKFDHSTTDFELVGQHQDVSCKSCHASLKFTETKQNCESCHKDIHQNSVGFDCERCHNTTSWLVPNVDEIHQMSRFPLLGAHKILDCNECHISNTLLDFKPLGVNCYDCHINNYQATTRPNHVVNNYSTSCEECHNIDAVTFSGAGIVHDFFPLTGGHNIGDCFSCHNENSFEGLSPECSSCHTDTYNATTNPSHITLGFSTDCAECHSISGWSPATFDHDAKFFPIYSGQHNNEWDKCSDCHTNNSNYAVFSCIDCHEHNQSDMKKEHSGVNGYVYESNGCFSCHPTGKKEGSFSHTQTFPLVNSHANVLCSDCHETTYTNTSTECNSCHLSSYSSAKNPNHLAAGISQQCELCHTESNWTSSTFNHTTTGFELLGSHATLTCSDCHSVNTSNAVQECNSCHLKDYNNSLNPNHAASGISQQCETCHESTTWIPSTFSHITTGYQLLGSHATLTCSDCHSINTSNAVQECNSCHLTDYNNSLNPNHAASGISQQCETCHESTTWIPSTFNHTTTGYQLLGSHAALTCSDCHSVNTSNAVQECNSCHLTDYNNSLNPNHAASGISQQCETCHESTTWIPSTFNHTTTGYQLLGSHAALTCSDCHSVNTSNAVQECFSCHESSYNVAPNHLAQNYPKTCETCHNTNSWQEATFDHSTTNFPLTGGHVSVDCNECHSSGYVGTSTECSSCHQDNFDNSINPNHKTLGLSNNCATCHSTNSGWEPALFPEHNNYFQLLGAHATITNNCADCHNGNYTPIATNCFSCHETNYNNTTNPSHLAAQFSTDCESCHNESAWTPSTFDHDSRFFPIYSGKHNGEWTNCVDCHINSNNYVEFSCVTCHEHNQTDTDRDHSGVNGYVYESNACYTCHPTGSEDGSFIHTQTFLLLGAHANATCVDCHITTYTNTSKECYSCHQTNFDNSANPNHKTVGISRQCELCHDANAWLPSLFNHTTTGFELVGSHTNVPCSNCHSVNTSNAVSECFSCHENSYTNAPNHVSQNYPQTCETCHSSNNWQESTFDHSTTKFALTGAHVTSNCIDCHASGYVETSTECSSCHQTNFDNSINPNHKTVGISIQCEKCHESTAWVPSTFNHTATGFELLGSHANATCADCHSVNTSNAAPECFSCHEDGYNTAANHLTQKYPQTCEICHNTNTWQEATFDHSATKFPLTGAHVNTNCVDCHVSGYVGTSTECSSCHQTDFDNSINPSHKTLGLSIDCATCHTTNANWEPATFSVHNNFYQLSGAHATIANNCIDCHNGNYTTAPNQCFGCHASDYNATKDPAHLTAQFSTDCESCHTENAWSPSTFNHDLQYFPIYSGEHRGEWNQCSECHTTATNYALFSCIDCHEHNNKSEVDKDHNGVNNYQYVSTACYDCHPKGTEDGLKPILKPNILK